MLFQITLDTRIYNFAENIREITSHLGEKREIHCEIPPTSSSQGSDVRWYFNNELLSSNDISRYNIHKNDRTLTSILTLIKVTDVNEGQYRCEFDNIVDKINLKIIRSMFIRFVSFSFGLSYKLDNCYFMKRTK